VAGRALTRETMIMQLVYGSVRMQRFLMHDCIAMIDPAAGNRGT